MRQKKKRAKLSSPVVILTYFTFNISSEWLKRGWTLCVGCTHIIAICRKSPCTIILKQMASGSKMSVQSWTDIILTYGWTAIRFNTCLPEYRQVWELLSWTNILTGAGAIPACIGPIKVLNSNKMPAPNLQHFRTYGPESEMHDKGQHSKVHMAALSGVCLV